MGLAAQLPFDHRFAGGFPGLSSQPLPTDADAIDYLTRVAAADGAGVEVSVAVAVDAFVRDLKATPGLFSALKACCILAGARTLAGALVPVVGDAPTNVANGFVEGDYTRGGATPGLTGDGTSYIDSGRPGTADGQNDHHIAFHSTTGCGNTWPIGVRHAVSPNVYTLAGYTFFSRTSSALGGGTNPPAGTFGTSRSEPGSFNTMYASGAVQNYVAPSLAAVNDDTHFVFAFNQSGAAYKTTGTIAFYSIGTSLSLEDLDTAVTNLITAIGEAL